MLIISEQVRQSSHPNKHMASTPAKAPTKTATKLPIIFWKTFNGPGVLIASWLNTKLTDSGALRHPNQVKLGPPLFGSVPG